MSEYIFFSFKKEGNPMKNVKFRRSIGKVKEISHLTVFLPEHIYSNSDVEVNIDELAFIITNKSTGDAITIAVETENADIEVRNKP